MAGNLFVMHLHILTIQAVLSNHMNRLFLTMPFALFMAYTMGN